MIGLKRFIRPGIVISVVAHVGAFALGLMSFAGSSPQTVPPPDAMEVELVTPTEAPRLQGDPSPERSSGSAVPFNGNNGNAATQQQPTNPATQPAQQSPQHSNPQQDAGREKAKPEKAQPKLAHAETAPPETEQDRTTESLPTPPEPQPEETPPDQPSAVETMAQLALAGGQFGGGFNAPPVNTPRAGYDFTAEFRERVSSCSSLPTGVSPGENVSIVMRVFLNRDGTLASRPQLMQPITSAKQKALIQSSISALQQCQPYTMLPPDKYNQWKKLDLTFYPIR